MSILMLSHRAGRGSGCPRGGSSSNLRAHHGQRSAGSPRHPAGPSGSSVSPSSPSAWSRRPRWWRSRCRSASCCPRRSGWDKPGGGEPRTPAGPAGRSAACSPRWGEREERGSHTERGWKIRAGEGTAWGGPAGSGDGHRHCVLRELWVLGGSSQLPVHIQSTVHLSPSHLSTLMSCSLLFPPRLPRDTPSAPTDPQLPPPTPPLPPAWDAGQGGSPNRAETPVRGQHRAPAPSPPPPHAGRGPFSSGWRPGGGWGGNELMLQMFSSSMSNARGRTGRGGR